MDDKLNLRNSRVTFDSQYEFVNYYKVFEDNITIPSRLPTSSNVNFKVINDLMRRFSLEPIDREKFYIRLNKLLVFRNAVAHGDNSIPVTGSDVENFCNLVNELMTEVFSKIEKGYVQQTYLK
jgi:DNA-binding ferritin-like protein (Dps family)